MSNDKNAVAIAHLERLIAQLKSGVDVCSLSAEASLGEPMLMSVGETWRTQVLTIRLETYRAPKEDGK